MKVIMISKVFLKGHPRQGEPTHFVQKVLHSRLNKKQMIPVSDISYPAKHHTIRAGQRWKEGDMASIRIWTGKPYRSKQEEIIQVEIKQVWPIEIDENGVLTVNGLYIEDAVERKLAMNDGLYHDDFPEWLVMPCFRKAKAFSGQIICWNDKIEY